MPSLDRDTGAAGQNEIHDNTPCCSASLPTEYLKSNGGAVRIGDSIADFLGWRSSTAPVVPATNHHCDEQCWAFRCRQVRQNRQCSCSQLRVAFSVRRAGGQPTVRFGQKNATHRGVGLENHPGCARERRQTATLGLVLSDSLPFSQRKMSYRWLVSDR